METNWHITSLIVTSTIENTILSQLYRRSSHVVNSYLRLLLQLRSMPRASQRISSTRRTMIYCMASTIHHQSRAASNCNSLLATQSWINWERLSIRWTQCLSNQGKTSSRNEQWWDGGSQRQLISQDTTTSRNTRAHQRQCYIRVLTRGPILKWTLTIYRTKTIWA